MTERIPRLVEEHRAAGRTLEVRGERIFVRQEGRGPPVLLLHGVPTSSFLYRKMIPELAAYGLHAIAFDFPGIGLSDKPRELAYDWHALAAWIEDIVRALELESVHLVVHDIAGPIGAKWAIDHPGRVRSLTIMNTLLDVATFRRPFPMNLFVVPGLRHLVFATQSPAVFKPVMHRRGVKYRERIDRDVMEAYIWLLKRGGGHRPFLEIMAGFDLTPELRDRLRDGLSALRLPMQLVWGEHEVAIPPHQLDYIRNHFALQAEHYVDARHFLQEDQPEQCAKHIAAFCLQH